MKNIFLILLALSPVLTLAQTYTMSDMTVTDCEGYIYDSGNTSGNYLNKENHVFVIHPQAATSITINFTSWDVEAGYDVLNIYSGTSTNAPLLGTFSASSPGQIQVDGNAITLEFISDESVTATGWAANWSANCYMDPITPNAFRMDEVNGQTLTLCEGMLYDGGGISGNYGDNDDFTVTINPGASIINLEFYEWDVEDYYDNLYIYDGVDTQAPLLGKYSGSAPSNISASSGSVTLRFNSDYSINMAGFKMSWHAGGGACSTMMPAPIANFNAVENNIEAGQGVQFNDMSDLNPTKWAWTFEGGTPATSDAVNPYITYENPGVYPVTLTAYNAFGEDTETKTGYIIVNEAMPTYSLSNRTVTDQCVGRVYDSGGNTGGYGNDEVTMFSIIVPEGAVNLTLEFTSWEVEAGYDVLHIHDGRTANAPLIGSYSGSMPPSITATGDALTLYFVSDNTVVGEGFEATWTSMGRGCGIGSHFKSAQNTTPNSIETFHLSPNPASNGFVIVDLALEQQEDIQVSVVDMNGKTIKRILKKEFLAEKFRVDISEVPTGMYIIQVQGENLADIQKLIVK